MMNVARQGYSLLAVTDLMEGQGRAVQFKSRLTPC